MISLWLTRLGSKLGAWFIGIFAVIAALGAAWLFGRDRGKTSQAQTDQQQQAQANVVAEQQVVQAVENRDEVEHDVQSLPAAPAQTVATADAGTAAGQLRDDGWMSD